MKFANKFINFFVGVITLFVGAFLLGIFTGEDLIGGLLMVAFFSIVCTYGVTLVIWIPAMVLLGAITTSVIRFLFKTKTPQLTESATSQSVGKSPSKPLSNNELAIIGYIISSRNSGTMDDMTIRLNLRRSGGWSDAEIDTAFNSCAPRK
jgi:hypothetical protein